MTTVRGTRPWRALIFDVDGTLYRQSPVRRAMARRLGRLCFQRPIEGIATVRMLRAYRLAQEALREGDDESGGLAERQLALAAGWVGVDVSILRETVQRWMEREPLAHVARARHPGVMELLESARRRGWRLGVLSDYPAAAKLEALQVTDFFHAVVCAQDDGVQRFKPDPRGLNVALERLGVPPDRAVYVGDRPDVDALAAERAGVRCVLAGDGVNRPERAGARGISYEALAGALEREEL